MKIVVVKLGYTDEKIKQKAMQSVSGLSGVVSIALDTKDKKLTVIGDIDPVDVVGKLRKLCPSEILSVGPVPEKKKKEPKKEKPAKKTIKKTNISDLDAMIAEENQIAQAVIRSLRLGDSSGVKKRNDVCAC